jgi:hypothetical protein
MMVWPYPRETLRVKIARSSLHEWQTATAPRKPHRTRIASLLAETLAQPKLTKEHVITIGHAYVCPALNSWNLITANSASKEGKFTDEGDVSRKNSILLRRKLGLRLPVEQKAPTLEQVKHVIATMPGFDFILDRIPL